jgi:hypothetical protein
LDSYGYFLDSLDTLEQKKRKVNIFINCGEATFCRALLVYLLENKSAELENEDSKQRMLFEKVRAEWNLLNEPV